MIPSASVQSSFPFLTTLYGIGVLDFDIPYQEFRNLGWCLFLYTVRKDFSWLYREV